MRLASLVLLVGLLGCEGTSAQPTPAAAVGGGGSGGSPATAEPMACSSTPSPGRSPLRRLNRSEYIATASELLGLVQAEELAGSLPPDEQGAGFSNNADALVVTNLLAETYLDVSERLAAAAVADGGSIAACSAAEAEATCVERFVATLGKRAFRRPISAEEQLRYVGMFNQARLQASLPESLGVVIRALLQSPHFLYRVEVGVPPVAAETVVPVTPHELAVRLSYALWGSMPDAQLFAAAENGALTNVAGIEQEVERMLQDERARRSIARFHREWLHIDGVSAIAKDPALFPESVWNRTLQNDLRNELETFVDQVFWNGGSLQQLLSAPFSYLNPNLAGFYGVPHPGGDGLVRVELDPGQRAGILTSGALLATLASNNQTSPVHRGKFVREQIMCQPLPAPPNNVVIEVPEVTTDTTTRERYQRHSADPLCRACHTLMDPIGFGFENYDPIGRFRTQDGPAAVDASGELVGTSAISGPFVGAVELAQRLSTSAEARDCATTQVFRYVVGRAESAEDACSLARLSGSFAESSHDLRRLWVAIATSDTFRYRSLAGGGT